MTDNVQIRLCAALADRYNIERELGAGGMATVYLAHDVRHDRKVAVKVMRPELAAILGGERFLREVQIAAKLNHPHILALHDSGEAEGFLYYVMPYEEGESLRDRLNREKQLPIADALKIATEVADALDSAHRHDVIHRDIKPENILLREGHAVVADFGIALAISAANGDRLTETGLSLGTPTYMSPEQIEGTEIDGRSDIYALGCVLFEITTGQPPFDAPTPLAIAVQHQTEPPPDPRGINADIPEECAELILKCLAKERNERYRTASHLLAEIERLRHPVVEVWSGLSVASVLEQLRRPVVALPAALVAIALVWFSVWFVRHRAEVRWAREVAIPEIERMIGNDDTEGAYALARQVETAIDDPWLDSLWSQISQLVVIVSDPPGAVVTWKPYNSPQAEWLALGMTPTDSVRLPISALTLRLEHDGYQPLEIVTWTRWLSETLTLRDAGQLPEGMCWIPGARVSLSNVAPTLYQAEPAQLGDYLIDQHEVTNEEYKEFVDAGGYETPRYWDHTFVTDGDTLSWETAMAEFVDRTGRPGPSTWEVSDFPDGEEDFPVTGISWYEAEAFARFTGRTLPTVYHWYHASGIWLGWVIIPASNINGDGPSRVGEFQSLGPHGTLDMVGNAREWVFNGSADRRFILGGAWSDPLWAATSAQTAPAFDRSETNGFRLATLIGDTTDLMLTKQPMNTASRDFANETPVPDDIFLVYWRMYAYDDAPLNAVLESADTLEDWRHELVSFDAAYGSERMGVHLFLPRQGNPPYQTVVYYPGVDAIGRRAFEGDYALRMHMPFVVKSGRAFAFPVYKSTFERSDGYEPQRQDESNTYRDHVIQWGKDLQRSIDYLFTRSDIDSSRLAYFGFSWGGYLGGIMMAIEPRLRTGILHIAGLNGFPVQPEVDPFNFVSRISIPVLMLSGRYDNVFPLETAATPMFELLGTPVEHKRHVVSESGHSVPLNQLARESLAWLDRYLGPVR